MGGMGKTWWTQATNQSPDFDLAAIVDINDAPLNESGDALNIPRDHRFKSLEDAIKHIKADAVLTITPPAIHVKHAELAFANGLHLMTEKPLADTLENARRMVDLAKHADKQLVVTQNYRYSAQAQKMKEICARGNLSAISVMATSTSTSPPTSPGHSVKRCSIRCSSIWPFTISI